MSLEFVVGGNVSYNEDIKAFYIPPKKEWELANEFKEAQDTNRSLQDIKDAYVRKMDIELNGGTNDETLGKIWVDEKTIFFGKDGTSDAYTKRGADIEYFEYFERQVTERQAWRFETSTSFIDFKIGGKVIIGEKEWVIMKVINQLNIGNIGNVIKARRNMDLIYRWGVKTLILS